MLHVINNNAIADNLSCFRKKATGTFEAWKCVENISFFLAGEISNNLNSKKVSIDTPLGTCESNIIDNKIELVPVLRAGFAMLRPFQILFPNANIGPIACQRNTDLSVDVLYEKISYDLSNSTAIILDTMLATGNTISKVIDILQERKANQIIIANILSVNTGVNSLSDFEIFTAGNDDTLDEKYYVYPGVGDSGDRLFGKVKG